MRYCGTGSVSDRERLCFMQEIRYADAGMDMKKLMLGFIRKSWLVGAAALAGAALAGAVYAAAGIVPESQREYQALSKVYLDFAPDKTGEVYQAYNGYTWNDLMATEPIITATMKNLPADYTTEEVVVATKAEILSDVRLLTITVTTHDRQRCDTILEATGKSLVELGDTAKEFERIRVIRTTQAALLVADSRLAQALLVGAAAGAVFMLLGMLLFYVLDDRIFVAGDIRQATDLPFVGYAGADARFGADYEEHLAYLQKTGGAVCLYYVAQGEEQEKADWQELRSAAGGVVLLVAYGKVHAAYLAYTADRLKAMGCRPVGVAISGADGAFLRRYYGPAGRK